MKFLTVFFSIMCLLSVGGCIACSFYADTLPVLGAAVKALICFSVGFALATIGLALAVIFKSK